MWAKFMRRWLFVTAAGLATYFLYPAAPPWYASKHGHLTETVYRTSTEGWHALGLRSAGKLLSTGQDMANPVAAMPSLHSAFAMLVVAFFLAHVSRRWVPVLLLYPVAMAFSLVYAGEHYVVDVLVGWAYVLVAMVVVSYAERWWAGRRDRLDLVTVGAAEAPVGDEGVGPAQ
jgi:membrane-associated phospholipid phosphatase